MSSDETPRLFPKDEHPHPAADHEPEPASGASADPRNVVERIREVYENNGLPPERVSQFGGMSWKDADDRRRVLDVFDMEPGDADEPMLPGFGPDGHGETAHDDCGDDHPFCCIQCARAVCLGRTCKQSVCSRCGVAWVRDAAISKTAKVIRCRKEKNSALEANTSLHHVVTSAPIEWWYDLGRVGLSFPEVCDATDVLVRDIMDEMGGVGVVVRHSYRGKDDDGDIRTDPDADEMGDLGMWKDFINSGRSWFGDVREELAWQPHYHAVVASDWIAGHGFGDWQHEKTGWVIHRITKETDDGRTVSLESDADAARALTYTLSHGDIIVNDDGNNESANEYCGYADGRSPWNDLAPEPWDRANAEEFVHDAAETVLGLYSETTECGADVPAVPVVQDQNELAVRILDELMPGASGRPDLDVEAEDNVLSHVAAGNINVDATTDDDGQLLSLSASASPGMTDPTSPAASASGVSATAGARDQERSTRLAYETADIELRSERDERSHLSHDHEHEPDTEECDGKLIPLGVARERGLLEDDALEGKPHADQARAADQEWPDDLTPWQPTVTDERAAPVGAGGGRSEAVAD